MTSRPYVETLVFMGGISADVRADVQEHPDGESEVAWGIHGRLEAGGRAASAAVGAVRLGRRFVDLIGCVGDDLLGDSMVSSLKDEGVSIRLVDKIPGSPTGMRQVVTDAKGDRRTVGVSNANWHCGDAQIRKADSTIFGADLLFCTLEVPLESVHKVVALAAQRNVGVLLDANPVPTAAGEDELTRNLLSNVDVLLVNWNAARRLAGVPDMQGPVAVELAKRLLRLGVKATVITMGEHGAMLANRGNHALVPAYSARVADPAGAGDAFAAALAVGLTDQARGGWRWEQLLHATKFASAAAAVAVGRFGGQESLPTRQEVERMMASQPHTVRRS